MIWVRCTSYTSSLLFSFMQFDGDCSALNLLASKAFDLPHPTKGRSSLLKSKRLRDHGEEGTNVVSYEPAADKTRHQGETLR
ncbi:hypothetical protein Bca52824_074513 [Brassica carinata]|uniref:Uncharacterized protein n=1 Tax=Brassica carinata TaxID=52824 RepID=A0A8X7PT93_BRACI|nr:hypothetical protein Bca52824_074513 [Brassica carinata]